MVSQDAIQTHIALLQNIITRMASNSTSCKTWCITIVSAILVLVADSGKGNYALLALMPTVLFSFLDAYYLGLERGFRKAYCEFVKKAHSKSLTVSDLYEIAPYGNTVAFSVESIGSFSVWPFYLMLAVMIWTARVFIIT